MLYITSVDKCLTASSISSDVDRSCWGCNNSDKCNRRTYGTYTRQKKEEKMGKSKGLI